MHLIVYCPMPMATLFPFPPPASTQLTLDSNFLGPLLPILRPTFLESLCNFQQFGWQKNDGYFFWIRQVFRTHVNWAKSCPERQFFPKQTFTIELFKNNLPKTIQKRPISKKIPKASISEKKCRKQQLAHFSN